MIKWIFNEVYINSNKMLFIIYTISMILIILITIYLVSKSLKENKNVNK